MAQVAANQAVRKSTPATLPGIQGPGSIHECIQSHCRLRGRPQVPSAVRIDRKPDAAGRGLADHALRDFPALGQSI